MSKEQTIEIPSELASYRDQILKTVKPFIHISLVQRETALHESKFAGNPYLPKNIEHPKDTQGKPMKLLAQLNFSELPRLEPMPQEGIVQFFISAEDDVLGIDFDDLTNQANFKVMFHSSVIRDEALLVTDFSYMNDLDVEFFPIEHEFGLQFEVKHEPVSLGDFRREELLGAEVDLEQEVNEKEELCDVYGEAFASDGHKVGGYPFFTQTDPRAYSERLQKYDILLLQIDIDDGIMWGDSGVANFFIRAEDLKNLDFTNVIYTWDCM